MWQGDWNGDRLKHRKGRTMSPYEAMFSNLVSYSLRPSDPFVKMEWDRRSGNYSVRLNHSEHIVTISDDEFTHSIANGRLEKSVLAKLVAALQSTTRESSCDT